MQVVLVDIPFRICVVSGKAPAVLDCSSRYCALSCPCPPVKERRKGLVQCNDYKIKRYNRFIPRDHRDIDVKPQPVE